MPTFPLRSLLNKHKGEACYLVGKGPSLLDLEDRHFGPGPVLCLNESILAVEELKLDNPLYSLQKDGLPQHMVPVDAGTTLILQKVDAFGRYSGNWFPAHPKRIVVDPMADMGFDYQSEMSVRMGIWLVKYMGCREVIFTCCDSLVNGDTRRVHVRSHRIDASFKRGSNYLYVKPLVLEDDVANFPHSFLTPE